jgi:hypothetical protein
LRLLICNCQLSTMDYKLTIKRSQMIKLTRIIKFTLIILGVSIALYYMITDWIPHTNVANGKDPYDTMK